MALNERDIDLALGPSIPNPVNPESIASTTTTSARLDSFYHNHPNYFNPAQTPNPNLPHPSLWMHPPSSITSSSRLPPNANPTDQPSVDAADASLSASASASKKVKFLCSFGGKILPRPSDGMLRYVGGHTRIISVRRDVTFDDFIQKLVDTYAQPVIIKYQLPDEDLDALVSVSFPDDLDNMMEEYEKLLERSSDGSAKLRLFLFNVTELDPTGLVQFGEFQDAGQRYVEAVNGLVEGTGAAITRKESIASAASTQNSDLSAADNFDAALSQDVAGPPPPSGNLFSPKIDSAASNNDFFPRLETSVPPSAPPLNSSSQPEMIESDKTIPLQLPVQQPPPTSRCDLPQSGSKFPPPPSPYLGGYGDPHLDALRLPSQMVYANPPQVLAATRPILIQPQFRDNAPTLLTQQYMPAVHMTMAPASAHLSVNPNIVQPVVQPQRVVAVPAEQGYNQAFAPQVSGGGYGWDQLTPQEHGAISQTGRRPHPPVVVPRTADCYMCQKALPHAHSDTLLQDQKDSGTTIVADTNPIYHSLCLDDIRRFQAVSPQHQGAMGFVGDVQNRYGPSGGNLPVSCPEHFVPSSQAKQEVLVTKPVNCDNTSAADVTYQIAEDFAIETSKDYPGKAPGVPLMEDTVRPAISNVRPVDLKMENPLINRADMLPSSEQDVSYQYNACAMEPFEAAQAPTPGDLANFTDIVSPGNDPRDDMAAKFPAIASSGFECATSNWGAIMNDSPNSLFSNQDPWNMRHDVHFPPPKPSKITAKRDVIQGENRLGHGGEANLEVSFVDGVRPTVEQGQTCKGLPEERIKQQLQATAEGVAASVLHSSVPSSTEFSSQEIDASVSEAGHETEGQNTSDAAIHIRMEAMNLKAEKANFGFPVSDGIGRLQIIKNGDLEELRELGSGTFGTVYHGKWRGTDVAIKRINDRCFAGKPSEEERMRNDFWNEAIKLADLHHPNVVAFYGVVLDGPGGSVATVTEYMVNGSLRTALQKNERNLDKRKRLLIAMDVAFGMEYLHSKNIVHFDLKSDNLLVNLGDPHRPICKVGDLGLSKVKCQTLISGGVRGTLPWMAPELLNGSSSLVSEKVDVFSFGIVMWELLTGEEPYADLHYGAIIGGIVSNTLRPLVPEYCDIDWRFLMERCWSAEPSERPNFTEIANELRAMASKVPSKGQMPLTSTRTNT